MGGVEKGRACCGGRRREDGGGGDYFSWFLIQEVKLAGTQAGERKRGRWVVGEGVGGVGTEGLFTKGSGATGMLYISSVSCPDFPTYRREQRGERDWAVDADELGLVVRSILHVNNSTLL